MDECDNFVIFPSMLTHSNVARKTLEANGFRIVSGGFISFDTVSDSLGEGVRPYCYGESISLGLKSRPEDSDIMMKKMMEA
jgi:hypothetical protein